MLAVANKRKLVWVQHFVGIQQGQLAIHLKLSQITNMTSARPASYSSNTKATVFCSARQDPLAELGDLFAVAQDNHVLADQSIG